MTMLSTAFDKQNRWLELSDEEMSTQIGGFPVFSFRPEDFPNFKPFPHKFTELEIQERAQAIHEKIKSLYPKYDLPIDHIMQMADSRTAFVHSFGLNGPVGFETEAFFILRPSLGLSYSERIASMSSVDPLSLQDHLSMEKSNFIDMAHEFCHVLNLAKNSKKDNDYEEELSADSYALGLFKARGGSEEDIRTYINGRALSSFRQPPLYWLAPALESRFIGESFLSQPSRKEVWQSYAELRLRVVMEMVGIDISGFSSAEVKHELWLWNIGELSNGPKDLVEACQSFQAIYIENQLEENPSYLIGALNGILSQNNLDEMTRLCANQILSAAKSLCPALLPASLEDTPYRHLSQS